MLTVPEFGAASLPPSTSSAAMIQHLPRIRHCVMASFTQYSASTGPPPPLPHRAGARLPLLGPVAKMSYVLLIRASVVNVGQSDSYTCGFLGSLLSPFSRGVVQKPRLMHVRTRG